MPNKESFTLFGFCFLVLRFCNSQYATHNVASVCIRVTIYIIILQTRQYSLSMNAGGGRAYDSIENKYIKVTHNKDTRRLKARNNLEEMKAHVAKTFKMHTNASYLSYMYFKYKDSDGDVISVKTEEDYQSALAQLPSTGVWGIHSDSNWEEGFLIVGLCVLVILALGVSAAGVRVN